MGDENLLGVELTGECVILNFMLQQGRCKDDGDDSGEDWLW